MYREKRENYPHAKGVGSISPTTCMQTSGLLKVSKKFLENMRRVSHKRVIIGKNILFDILHTCTCISVLSLKTLPLYIL